MIKQGAMERVNFHVVENILNATAERYGMVAHETGIWWRLGRPVSGRMKDRINEQVSRQAWDTEPITLESIGP